MTHKLSGLAALVASCLLAGACGRLEEPASLSRGAQPVAGLEQAGLTQAVLTLDRADLRSNPGRPAGELRLAENPRDTYTDQRRKMIEDLESRGIKDPRLLAAMEQVPRHFFVPASLKAQAYEDKPLRLDNRRSIHQPYVVALMTSLLNLRPDSRVLEIGTGSGYHTAVLARLAREVYTIEIDGSVSRAAAKRLEGLGYHNVLFHVGDGYAGWPSELLPRSGGRGFDAIVLTAAPLKPPEPLLEQLKVGGRMVVPVGSSFQDLTVITKRGDGTLERKTIAPVRVSRMEGQAQGGRR